MLLLLTLAGKKTYHGAQVKFVADRPKREVNVSLDASITVPRLGGRIIVDPSVSTSPKVSPDILRTTAALAEAATASTPQIEESEKVYLRFDVEDTGIGLDAEQQQMLFRKWVPRALSMSMLTGDLSERTGASDDAQDREDVRRQWPRALFQSQAGRPARWSVWPAVGIWGALVVFASGEASTDRAHRSALHSASTSPADAPMRLDGFHPHLAAPLHPPDLRRRWRPRTHLTRFCS